MQEIANQKKNIIDQSKILQQKLKEFKEKVAGNIKTNENHRVKSVSQRSGKCFEKLDPVRGNVLKCLIRIQEMF